MMSQTSFLSAPHRVMFLGGTAQALLAMAFWSLQTGGHYAGLWPMPVWPFLAVMPASHLHGLLMTGVFAWFVFGFILTAGPRWQGAREMARTDYLPPFLLLASGWTIVWIALVFPGAFNLALAALLCGWVLLARLVLRIAMAPSPSREHIGYVAAGTGLGCVGIAVFLAMTLTNDLTLGSRGITLIVWGFLLPVFTTVAHRMLPFFTASALRGYVARRPAWALRVLIACSLIHGMLSILGWHRWTWIADLPAAISAARLTWLWWDRTVLGNRLVSVLHLAFAWLSPAFAVFALQSLMPGLLGQAPMHMLTLGFFASMLIGMASRVTLGHSGRPVVADRSMWTAFLAMQIAAVVRITAELPLSGALVALWVSSLAWLLAFGLWARRYAPALWRSDDESGRD